MLVPNSYQRAIYSHFLPPIFSTKPSEWERLASLKVPSANFGYVQGNASSGQTYVANLSAFQRFRLKPRMLVAVNKRDLSVELFGERYPTPLLAAPSGCKR